MTRQSRIFFLTQIAECFEKEHMDTEAEVIRSAIYDIGILDEVKKERDAAIAMAQPEIIRCKDCKYFYENKWCIRYLKAFLPDEFCSAAKRRTDG